MSVKSDEITAHSDGRTNGCEKDNIIRPFSKRAYKELISCLFLILIKTNRPLRLQKLMIDEIF